MRCLRPTLLAGLFGLLAAGCGSTDPAPRAEDTTTSTTEASTTTTSEAQTSLDADVRCGDELPYFPTEVFGPATLTSVDVEGQPGPSADGDPVTDTQLVRHWNLEGGVSIEMRWPPGPGPDVGSAVVLTQLLETTDQPPCNSVRVSAHGPEGQASDAFAAFVASLDGIDVKADFVAAEADRLTPAVAETPGACAEPIVTELDENGLVPDAAAALLVSAYVEDRTGGFGYEDCLTVSGLTDVQTSIDELGETDLVRPAGQVSDNRAEVLTSHVSDGSLVVWREVLTITAIGDGDEKQILFSAMIIGPDSLVGEDEASAFIDEFLLLLADEDYEQAAGYLVNEGVTPEVEEAMPTIFDDPAGALEEYCDSAACAVEYKISDTIEFDGSSRTIEVTYFHPDGTIEVPTRVGVFEGQLSIGTPPPLEP